MSNIISMTLLLKSFASFPMFSIKPFLVAPLKGDRFNSSVLNFFVVVFVEIQEIVETNYSRK